MAADITLTFEAIGAAKIAEEIKKIQSAIKDATKGFDSTLSDAADEAAESFEELGESAEESAESMDNVQRSSGKAKTGIVGIGIALAAATAAIAAAKKAFDVIVDGIHNAFKAGAEFSKMAASLGVDAGQAQLLSQAFTEAGMSAESVVPMVSKMQRKIAEGSAAFEALGMDVEALKGKSALEQMEAIGEAVRKVGDQEGKMKVLMAIFEEAGPQLSKFFENPDALDNASKTLGSSVKIMSENAEAFDRAAVLISNVGVKIGTFFQGVASGVVGPLSALLEALNSVDLAAEGKKFGDAIHEAAEVYYKAFLNDQFFELLATKFSAASSSFLSGARDVWAPIQDIFSGAVAGAFALVETGLDFAGRGLDKIGLEGTSGMTSRKGFVGTFTDYANENKRAADRATGEAGDVFAKRKKEWAELERQLMNSIKRSTPGDPFAPKEEKKTPKINVSDFKLDLSGLLKGGSGSNVSIPSDALQRVGGSIGGMTGAAIAPARKTADNTSKLVGMTNEIRTTLKSRSGSNIAVFA